MIFGLSPEACYLMLVGAFGVSIGHAAVRRQWAWVLALGLPLLLCAGRAGLPDDLVAWACAGWAAAIGLALIGLTLRTLGPAIGLPALLALGLFTAGNAGASHLDLAAPSLNQPPALGLRVEALLDILVRG